MRQRSPEPEPGPSAMHVEDDAKQSAETTTERAEKPVRPTETLVISQDDARFLIGAQGKTKKKLMKVSGASIEISAIEGDAEGKQRLEIASEDEAKLKFARECCEWVLQQRVGKIVVDTSVERDYLSAIDVDPECVAYVTGAQGSGLRRIEADYGTLMFFATRSTHPEDEGEKLIIVGSRKGRRGSELSVMAACERKKPGTHVNEETKLRNRFEQPGDGLGDGWGFDVFPFANQDELSFAIGRGVSTFRHAIRLIAIFFLFLYARRVDPSGAQPCRMCDHSSYLRAKNKLQVKYAGVICLAAVGQYAVQRAKASMSIRTFFACLTRVLLRLNFSTFRSAGINA